MIRVEVKNHEENFDLLKIFEDFQEQEVQNFLKENESLFLRVVKTGNPRKVIYQNF